ncbi:MAG: aminotransferase class V-fold PLP-dependent enzyme [Myxococcales bacterium]|nr:aminotransferase class V-fold PLP-dependent enzyme [Myxococcales bacterium]
MIDGLREHAKPYGDELPRNHRLPSEGRPRAELLAEIEAMNEREAPRWRDGFVSGAVYHGDPEHIEFLSRVYALTSQQNPLHSDLWPSATKFEAEIVSMTAHMLGAGLSATDPRAPADIEREVVGVVSSGGTESILLAMKTYRDRARAEKKIERAEIVAPTTAHAAFDKAARYFGMKLVKVPVRADDLRADVDATRAAITGNTAVVVGSAPSFPHGVIDPIEELSELARERGVGCHVDACLGGFVLPWAQRLGAPVPPFDFRLPGVTSMSADTHKYGYAAKGTSVVLYRGRALRRYQYYSVGDWPGGLYFSPTFAGSRPGALSAACWATMLSIGEAGYLEATRKILDAGKALRRGIREIDGLRVLGDPLWVIAFAAEDPEALDIYRVLDAMSSRRWNLNGLQRPACVHIAVTLRHAAPGVVERFLADLAASVDEARQRPKGSGGMAPVYGMAATLPVGQVVSDVLERYLDMLYEV